MRGTRLSLHWPALVFQPLLPPLVSACPSNFPSSSWRVDPSVGRLPPGTRSHRGRFYMLPPSPLCVLARNTLPSTWHPPAEGGWQLHSTKLTLRALGSVNCDCITKSPSSTSVLPFSSWSKINILFRMTVSYKINVIINLINFINIKYK